MSEFSVTVFKLEKFGKAKNSDNLSIVDVEGVPVLFNTNQFSLGQLVAHVPHDAVVSLERPEFKFLDDGSGEKTFRVRAKKLRGITSYGFLVPAPDGSKPGDNAAAILGIKKYEEPVPLSSGGETAHDPGYAPKYTDIQKFNKYNHVLNEGEGVVVTEKIHGCNAMYLFKNNTFYVRSHKEYKRDDALCSLCNTAAIPGNPRCPEPSCNRVRTVNLFWRAATLGDLEAKLRSLEGLAVFGEIFGQVQDLKYGATKDEIFFRAFDVYDTHFGRYLDHQEAQDKVHSVGIPWVPELYRGPYTKEKIESLVEGKSSLADNIREGVVIKPLAERFDEHCKGRVILKYISEQYHLRKKGTEHH